MTTERLRGNISVLFGSGGNIVVLTGPDGSVARLKRESKTLDEVTAARPTAAYDARWGGFVIDPAFFTRLVYAGV